LTAVLFFCCELQVLICLMSSISATSDTVIHQSSRMRASAHLMWSWVCDTDRQPDQASSDMLVLPNLNVSLTHTASTTILCYDSLVNISGSDPFCPKKTYHSMLFKDGTIRKLSIHVYTDTASARMTMECCAIQVQTCQHPVIINYNRSVAIAFGTRLIHKLPLLFDLLS
jgi:hypothetical protein